MKLMQTRMFTIIQDLQKNVGKMYIDWKAAGFGGGSQVESDFKWINVSVKCYFINIFKLI